MTDSMIARRYAAALFALGREQGEEALGRYNTDLQALCEQVHLWPDPLRSIGIRALELVPACAPHQLDLFEDAEHRARQRQLDITLDNLRARYGKTCVLRGRACFDPALGLVQREEHAFLRK